MTSVRDHFAHLKVPLEAIKLATNDFGDDKKIGQGGFGKVYKGELVLSGRRVMVAVKRLDPRYGQGFREFWKEIMMLSRCKHENLVSLLGYNDDRVENGVENILVYEYLPNQSLDMYLSTTSLSWIQRLIICLGVARGLEYLHNPGNTTERVLHLDIKSSNILLDQNWNAKISDFGLSKLGPANQDFTILITYGVGTRGYIDPLVLEGEGFTKESDIYSFGVVLFEVLYGRLFFVNCDNRHPLLVKLARSCYEKNEIGTIVHDCIREQISPKCLDNFSGIAYQCLQRERHQRPPIAEIVKRLELALEYQVKHDNIEKEKKLKSHDEVEEDMQPLSLSVDCGDTSMTEEQLKAYDGKDPNKPLLIAIKGQIYDVSRNRMLYEPDGPYAMFAGKDVGKALAEKSFEENDSNEDVNDPSPFELEILKDWQERFTSKYAKVGFLEDPILHRERRIYKGKNQNL